MAGEAIYLSQGTRAQIAAATIDPLEGWRETDGGRMGVGSVSAGKATFLRSKNAMTTVALSAAGDTTLALLSKDAEHEGLVTVAAGSGAYQANVILPATVTGIDGATSVAFVAGDRVQLRVEVAASANPSVDFFHNATGGTALLQLDGDAGAARTYLCEFRHDGSAWVVWDVRQLAA